MVLEEKVGRLLVPGEVCHHINAVRDDDRPENLELLNYVLHARLEAGKPRGPHHEGWNQRISLGQRRAWARRHQGLTA